jgi:hypothetical protein
MQVETFTGRGRLLTLGGQELAPVDYEYQIDRTHRVWKGVARRIDSPERLATVAGPAQLEVSTGDTGPVHFYHRNGDAGVEIVFTGRGAPPGE